MRHLCVQGTPALALWTAVLSLIVACDASGPIFVLQLQLRERAAARRSPQSTQRAVRRGTAAVSAASVCRCFTRSLGPARMQESRFQIGQMDDASEAMEAIFSRIHVEQVLVAQGLSLDTNRVHHTHGNGTAAPANGSSAGAGGNAGAGASAAAGTADAAPAAEDPAVAAARRRSLGAFSAEELACTPTCVAHDVFGYEFFDQYVRCPLPGWSWRPQPSLTGALCCAVYSAAGVVGRTPMSSPT